jgi:hypothetical protein
MLTQEDRLLHNPQFAPAGAAEDMGLPDFKDMVHHAIALEISDRKGDWEPVTDAEVGRAAAEMMGVVTPPAAFQAEPTPVDYPEPETLPCGHPVECDPARNDPDPGATHYCMACAAAESPPVDEPDPEFQADPTNDPTTSTTVTPQETGETSSAFQGILPEHKKSYPSPKEEAERQESEVSESTQPSVEGKWKVRGDSTGKDGKHPIYEVVLHADGRWECECPSRENPCKHARDLAFRIANAPRKVVEKPVGDPRPPVGAPVQPVPSRMNTSVPQGGLMVGGGVPDPPVEESDPWAPAKSKDRVIEVGGRVTFGSGKKRE